MTISEAFWAMTAVFTPVFIMTVVVYGLVISDSRNPKAFKPLLVVSILSGAIALVSAMAAIWTGVAW